MADKPLLNESDLEPLDAVDLLPPRKAVDKKTGLPLVSPQLSAKSDASDEELGLQTGLVDVDRSYKQLFRQFIDELKGKDTSGRGPELRRMDKVNHREVAEDELRQLPVALAGGLAGKAIGGALAGKAVSSAAPRAGHATFQELMSKAINNTANNSLRNATIHSLEKMWGIGPLAAKGADVAFDAVPAAAKSAVTAIAKTAPAVAPRGVMSNVIDRLRASPSARAKELLSRIDALNPGAGTGTVTQGTLGSE